MRVPMRLATLTSCCPGRDARGRAAESRIRPEPVDARLEALKQRAVAEVDDLRGLTQQMIDQVYSFASWASRRLRPRAT